MPGTWVDVPAVLALITSASIAKPALDAPSVLITSTSPDFV
jgi:hypothetical protein